MDKFYLYKSARANKKYTMVMPWYDHIHNFGSKGMRDRTLINDPNSKFYIEDKKERERVIQGYKNRHGSDNITTRHSPGALSWYILWSGDTLEKGIKRYEDRFNVIVIDKTNEFWKKK